MATKYDSFRAPTQGDDEDKKPFRGHIFTCYNMEWNLSMVDWKKCTYVTVNAEVCPETKRPHYQGYAEFSTSIRRSQVHEILGNTLGGYANPRCGTQEQAIHYCRKPVEGCDCKHCAKARASGQVAQWIEHGEKAKGQGTRSDLNAACEDLKAGATMREMAKNHTQSL